MHRNIFVLPGRDSQKSGRSIIYIINKQQKVFNFATEILQTCVLTTYESVRLITSNQTTKTTLNTAWYPFWEFADYFPDPEFQIQSVSRVDSYLHSPGLWIYLLIL